MGEVAGANGPDRRSGNAADPAHGAVGPSCRTSTAGLKYDSEDRPAQDLHAGFVVRDRGAGDDSADEEDQEPFHIAGPAGMGPTLGGGQPGREDRRPERQCGVGQRDVDPPGPANSIQAMLLRSAGPFPNAKSPASTSTRMRLRPSVARRRTCHDNPDGLGPRGAGLGLLVNPHISVATPSRGAPLGSSWTIAVDKRDGSHEPGSGLPSF